MVLLRSYLLPFTFLMLGQIPSVLCGQWQVAAATGTKASLRGIHNAGDGVIWASGSGGTILHTVDNGSVWQRCSTPPGGEKLDFRGIWGFNRSRAIVLSSGPGDASRVYETTDGCDSWHILLTNPDAAGFWDTIAFNGKMGVLLGDPVDKHFVIYRTADGGRHWTRETSAVPAASPKGEGAFAASNSALVIRPDGKKILFGTGGPGGSRVFLSDSKAGGNWTAVDLPWAGRGDPMGAFSCAFRDGKHGVVVGGDYKNPAKRDGTAAFTSDGGVNWRAAVVPPGGYRSAVAWDQQREAWIAVGSNGSDLSRDDGQTWERLDDANWNALSLPWAAGSNGRIARFGSAR